MISIPCWQNRGTRLSRTSSKWWQAAASKNSVGAELRNRNWRDAFDCRPLRGLWGVFGRSGICRSLPRVARPQGVILWGRLSACPTGFHPVHQPKAGFGVRRQSLPARSRHVHELAHCWPGISGLFAWLSSRASASEICFSWLISVSSWTSCWVRSGARIRPRLPEPQPFSRLPCQLLLCRSPNRPRSCLFSCLPYRPLVRRNSRRSAYEGSTFAALVVGFRDRLRYPESLPRRYWGDARGSGAEGVAAAVIPKWCQPPGRATGCCRDARP
jgi:hypothetical protein